MHILKLKVQLQIYRYAALNILHNTAYIFQNKRAIFFKTSKTVAAVKKKKNISDLLLNDVPISLNFKTVTSLTVKTIIQKYFVKFTGKYLTFK